MFATNRTIEEQVEIIEEQINSPESNFGIAEKLVYIDRFFVPDTEFSQKAIDIVFMNIMKNGG